MKNASARYNDLRYLIFLSLIILVLFFFFPLRCGANTTEPSSVETLLSISKNKQLHTEKYWWTLLHYRETLMGVESQVDDPKFFLAADGKVNPEAEIKATIQALFQKDIEAAKPMVCRFFARYKWLREKLSITQYDIPELSCEEIQTINPKSVSLVFPTYYMNSPASMFGHTLLIIKTDYTSKRLANAVNYAAQADDVNGFSFAVKGLFGFYKGYYSVLPYYKKIQEYSDINQRDIWEYQLNLDQDEMNRMIWHIKELDMIYTYYYFFDENCSYNLLFLLESARPSLSLTDQFPIAVLPIDTIKAVADENLISAVEFRPSKATKLKHKIDGLDESEKKKALQIIHENIPPSNILDCHITHDKKIRILDLIIDEIQYMYAKNRISQLSYQQKLMQTLAVRSKLGKPDNPLYNFSPPPRPENGHDSKKASIGIGSREGDLLYEITFRPAFTDLLDSDYVHNQGAQIEFGDIRFRYYPWLDEFQLYQFDLIDIVSISPRDDFFKPISWKVNTGFFQKTMGNSEEHLMYRLNTGGGWAIQNNTVGLFYLMFEGELNVGGALEKSYALGIGPAAGIIKQLTAYWKAHMFGRTIGFGMGDEHVAHRYGLSNSFKLTRNNSINLGLSWERVHSYNSLEGSLAWCFYF